jgi:hypothetical protein
MTVQATTVLPAELAGTYHLAWREGRFGLMAEGIAGLPVHGVVEGSILSTSTLGQAWVRWPLADYQATHPLALRYTLWDLPRLLDSAPDTARSGDTFTASLDLDGRDGAETHLELRREAGRVVGGRVETSLDPGAPFTFTREDPHPFPMVPEPSLEQDPMLDGDSQAMAGHQVLLDWIRQHHDAVGAYPEAINAEPGLDTLFLQSFNRDWPTSPYDGQPMADAEREGHFRWEICSPEDATFTGLGWDGAVLVESFGKGCSKGQGGREHGTAAPPATLATLPSLGSS